MTTSLTSKHLPNHILLGSSQPNVEPSNYENVEVSHCKKWRAVQAYTNLFWKRWLSEYLPTLSPRTKWTNKQQNFAARDLVIVRNKSIPKSHCPLARIVSIYPGDNGILRTVKTRTPSGEFVRPSQLLTLLENSKKCSNQIVSLEREIVLTSAKNICVMLFQQLSSLSLSGLATALCAFFYYFGKDQKSHSGSQSKRNWNECSESDKVRIEVRVTKPHTQYWSNLLFFIFQPSHSVFTWLLSSSFVPNTTMLFIIKAFL